MFAIRWPRDPGSTCSNLWSGYIRLAQALATEHEPPCEPFNFGPTLQTNRSVRDLVATILQFWPGTWVDHSDPAAPHESHLLHLQIDKAHHRLGWRPLWDYDTTVRRTVNWYLMHSDGKSAVDCCLADLQAFQVALEARQSPDL